MAVETNGGAHTIAVAATHQLLKVGCDLENMERTDNYITLSTIYDFCMVDISKY